MSSLTSSRHCICAGGKCLKYTCKCARDVRGSGNILALTFARACAHRGASVRSSPPVLMHTWQCSHTHAQQLQQLRRAHYLPFAPTSFHSGAVRPVLSLAIYLLPRTFALALHDNRPVHSTLLTAFLNCFLCKNTPICPTFPMLYTLNALRLGICAV